MRKFLLKLEHKRCKKRFRACNPYFQRRDLFMYFRIRMHRVCKQEWWYQCKERGGSAKKQSPINQRCSYRSCHRPLFVCFVSLTDRVIHPRISGLASLLVQRLPPSTRQDVQRNSITMARAQIWVWVYCAFEISILVKAGRLGV